MVSIKTRTTVDVMVYGPHCWNMKNSDKKIADELAERNVKEFRNAKQIDITTIKKSSLSLLLNDRSERLAKASKSKLILRLRTASNCTHLLLFFLLSCTIFPRRWSFPFQLFFRDSKGVSSPPPSFSSLYLTYR